MKNHQAKAEVSWTHHLKNWLLKAKKEIWFQIKICNRNTVILAFFNIFNQNIKMFNIKNNKSFGKKNKQ